MNKGDKRTLSAETTEGAADELGKGSHTVSQRIPTTSRQSRASEASSGLHWARLGDLRVLTCAHGKAHIVVVGDGTIWSVYVLRRSTGRSVRHLGDFSTRSEAEARAEQKALRVGVDSLALRGSWQSPATTSQKRVLRDQGIPFRPDITKRKAGDRIALSIAEQALRQIGVHTGRTKSRSARSAG